MKIKYLVLSALFLIVSCTAFAQEFTFGSFNVRFSNTTDTGNLWEDRKEVAANLLRFHQFDVFGTQEARKNQIDDLSSFLPEYAHYGKGRDDGKEGGEHSTIFYLKDKFKLLGKGDFWLSETPDKPGLGWDATCCNRIASWVYLQDRKSGKKFYFFNAHFDHHGKIARVESSKLVMKKIKEIAGNQPAVFTGDLNGDHASEWYKSLQNSGLLFDTYTQVKHPYVNNASFNGWGKQVSATGVIDHIFVTKHFTAKRWGILTDTYRGKFVSDHFPILADVVLK